MTNSIAPTKIGKASDHLANERTFLEWIRTSISIIVFGFVAAKFGITSRVLNGPVRQEMKLLRELVGAWGGYVYSAAVPASRPPADSTMRVMPHRAGVAVPLEVDPILWQR